VSSEEKREYLDNSLSTILNLYQISATFAANLFTPLNPYFAVLTNGGV